MTISVWRYSHLALAVSSFLFITLAAITGFMLAFQPITEKLPAYRAHDFNQVTLAQSIPAIRKAYPGVTDIIVDANQFVAVKGTDAQGKKISAYVDPRSGKVLGFSGKPNEFFQWVTSLHRSLFLHETGRFFVGLTSFLLFLIAVSGTVLVIQRQRGVKRFFKHIVKEGFAQYYHVILGRVSLIPIIIIALTGTLLSLSKFGVLPQKKIKQKVDIDAIKSGPQKKAADFDIFKNTPLNQVQSIEFPFSEFPEDYYTLKLKDREVAVNQFTGEVLSEVRYPLPILINNLSLDLHTGRTSAVWAFVLAIASLNILFFIYSGFVITWKRRANRVKKNRHSAIDSQFIILTGSENGSTFHYANAILEQLLAQGRKAYLAELNSYTTYPQATHLVILTSTYGLGDAPTNAGRFTDLLLRKPQQQTIQYSVLGFGSHAYPDFCKFAFDVNQSLAHQPWATPLIDIHTVNDKSPDDFSLWAEAWSQQTGITLDLPNAPAVPDSKLLKKLLVKSNSGVDATERTFLLRLEPKDNQNVTSGDLLAIYPAGDHRERLYSIGVIDKEIQLSVRLHSDGLGSAYLNKLKPGEVLNARIVNNPHFHFPQQASSVIMISNGTGIAPFLGMINQNSSKIACHLYCGFRDTASFKIYQPFLDEHKYSGQLNGLNLALSREGEKQYVSDLLAGDALLITDTLKGGGVLMLCGSLSMQKDVLNVLENICNSHTGRELSYYQSHGQILMDCY